MRMLMIIVVQRLAEDNNLTHKTLINDLLRQGIRVDSEPRLAPFEIKPFKTKLAKRHHDG